MCYHIFCQSHNQSSNSIKVEPPTIEYQTSQNPPCKRSPMPFRRLHWGCGAWKGWKPTGKAPDFLPWKITVKTWPCSMNCRTKRDGGFKQHMWNYKRIKKATCLFLKHILFAMSVNAPNHKAARKKTYKLTPIFDPKSPKWRIPTRNKFKIQTQNPIQHNQNHQNQPPVPQVIQLLSLWS